MKIRIYFAINSKFIIYSYIIFLTQSWTYSILLRYNTHELVTSIKVNHFSSFRDGYLLFAALRLMDYLLSCSFALSVNLQIIYRLDLLVLKHGIVSVYRKLTILEKHHLSGSLRFKLSDDGTEDRINFKLITGVFANRTEPSRVVTE